MTNDLGSDNLSLKQLLIAEEKGFSTLVQIGLHPRNFRDLCLEGLCVSHAARVAITKMEGRNRVDSVLHIISGKKSV